MQRYKEAKKSFERAIKADRKHADAYNNLGVIYYQERSYNAAIRNYRESDLVAGRCRLLLQQYGRGLLRQETVRQSHTKLFQGAWSLIPTFSSEPRAAESWRSFLLPKTVPATIMFSPSCTPEAGAPERSLHYLKKAMEEGYKDIKNVYKDNEFSTLRKDPRFAELMASKTLAIPD